MPGVPDSRSLSFSRETVIIKEAVDWVYHDQLDVFMYRVERFVAD